VKVVAESMPEPAKTEPPAVGHGPARGCPVWTNEVRVCGCRCGGVPSRGATFLQGHDSKVVPKLVDDHGSMAAFWAWYDKAMKDRLATDADR